MLGEAGLRQRRQEVAPILVGIRGEGESGPLRPARICWACHIEFVRLTKGLRTARVDALGSAQ